MKKHFISEDRILLSQWVHQEQDSLPGPIFCADVEDVEEIFRKMEKLILNIQQVLGL